MLYYKPEEWDDLGDEAMAFCESHGYTPLIAHVYRCMTLAWTSKLCGVCGTEYDPDDLNNLATMCAFSKEREAFGAYNSLLILAGRTDNPDVWHQIYDWGHYGVFY